VPAVIELHAHSTASDGTLDPAQLVARAAQVGVTTLALTDHDTVDGCEAALDAGARDGVTVVPGIELSVRVPRGTFHLLGYFAEPAPPVLVARMDDIARTREERNATIMQRLAALGVGVDPDLVRAAATGRVGRPHIAAALVAAGHCEDYLEAFDRYLGDGGAAYVPAGALDPVEAVELVKAAGGAASLAHPGTLLLDADGLDALVAELAAAGLDAVEAYRGDTPADEQAAYAALAGRHGLLATGGSDYHGPALEERGRVLGSCGEPGADPAALRALLARIG
jgi:predicted metal-dependent phosphoesterase TrpH